MAVLGLAYLERVMAVRTFAFFVLFRPLIGWRSATTEIVDRIINLEALQTV